MRGPEPETPDQHQVLDVTSGEDSRVHQPEQDRQYTVDHQPGEVCAAAGQPHHAAEHQQQVHAHTRGRHRDAAIEQDQHHATADQPSSRRRT